MQVGPEIDSNRKTIEIKVSKASKTNEMPFTIGSSWEKLITTSRTCLPSAEFRSGRMHARALINSGLMLWAHQGKGSSSILNSARTARCWKRGLGGQHDKYSTLACAGKLNSLYMSRSADVLLRGRECTNFKKNILRLVVGYRLWILWISYDGVTSVLFLKRIDMRGANYIKKEKREESVCSVLVQRTNLMHARIIVSVIILLGVTSLFISYC